MTEQTPTVRRDVALPAAEKKKMRLHAAASGETLGQTVAGMVRAYADGKYDGGEGRINVANVPDPGPQPTDSRVKFDIEESVWEQARVRSIMDDTSLISVLRRAAIALNG